MEITVVFTHGDISPDVLSLLAQIGQTIGGHPVSTHIPELAEETKTEPVKAARTRTRPAAAKEPEITKEEEPDTSSEEVSFESIRVGVTERAQSGKRAAVKKLLTSFGVEKLTELDKSEYESFAKKLSKI